MVTVIKETSSFDFEVVMSDKNVEVHRDVRLEKYLDELCFRFGKTLKGSREVVKKYLHIRQMVPICLYAEWVYVLFPIIDKETKLRIWLNYEQLLAYEVRHDCCDIMFKNGYVISCHVSKRSLQRQLDRCFFLLYIQYCFIQRV